MRADMKTFLCIRKECTNFFGAALFALPLPMTTPAMAQDAGDALAARFAARNAGAPAASSPTPSVGEAAALIGGEPRAAPLGSSILIDQEAGSARSDLQVRLDRVDGPVAATALAAGNIASVTLGEGQPATVRIRQRADGDMDASATLHATRLGGHASVNAVAMGNSVALTADGRLAGGDILVTQDNRGAMRATTGVRADLASGRIAQSAVAIGNNVTITGGVR